MAQSSIRGLHYAWVVLAAACVLNVLARADQASFGVFIDPLVELFGWTRGDISFAYSLAFLIGLPAVVIMGWLGDRFGARQLMLIAAGMIGVGTVLLGYIEELWQFYIIYGIFVGTSVTSTYYFYYNSIHIGGNYSLGSTTSRCLYFSSSQAATIRNNVLSNERVSTGTGTNHAIYRATNVAGTFNCNYNLVYLTV